MSSLLSPFHFGQKHAYFHVQITVHELANIPLIDGSFKARWRVKNTHNLQSIPASQGDDPSPSAAATGSEEGGGGGGGDRKTLQHKKSFASSIASQEITSCAGKDSPKSIKEDKGNTPRERKTSHRFLSGFKEALHKGTRRPSSSSNDPKLTAEESEDRSKGEQSAIIHKDSTRRSAHSKEESFDSIAQHHRPKRASSFNDNASAKMSTLSSKTLDEDKSHSNTSFLLQLEPRGETNNEKIKDHHVKWDKTIDVGVRIPVVKNKLVEKGGNNSQVATASGALSSSTGQQQIGGSTSEAMIPSASSSGQGNRTSMSGRSLADSSKNGEGDSRADKFDKELKDKDRDREMADAWGMLGNTELKVTIKADISTDRNRTKDSESHVTMGYVIINLAELAPYPESSAHQHHHHSSHNHLRHLNHSHHHHHHSHHTPVLFREDIRRYLLTDSRSNATLKLTVQMTHVGGTKEYSVPVARKGLIVAGASALMHDFKSGDSGSNSEASHSTEGHLKGAGSRVSGLGEYRNSGHANDSIISLKEDPLSAWPSNSVARHGRIPSSNLKTELSHQDAARAVKEAGGQRMGFSFGAGAHHDRPPEEVMEAIFSPSPSKSLFQPTNKRGDRLKGSSSSLSLKKKKSESNLQKNEDLFQHQQQSQQPKKGNQIERGLLSKQPAHFEGLTLAENPRDSAQSRGEPLSRLPSEPGAPDSQPGPDFKQDPITDRNIASKPLKQNSSESSPSQHRRNSSNGTVKSILANPKSSASSQGKKKVNTLARTSSHEQPSANSASKASPTSTVSAARTNLVHWDANLIGHDVKEEEDSPLLPLPTGGLTIPVPHLTASPSAMSRDLSEDFLFAPIPKSSSSRRTASTNDDQGDGDEDDDDDDEDRRYRQMFSQSPPNLPPDVVQAKDKRQQSAPLDSIDVRMDLHSKGASRRLKGLSKEEALKQGYRGAGWGTLNILWPFSISTDNSEYPLDVYTESATPQMTMTRDAVQ